MDKKEIQDIFSGILKNEEDVSAGVAAIRTLFKVLEHYKSETVQELDSNLQFAIEVMRNTDYPVTAIVSGCELFRRFITLAKLDTTTFDECKQIMLERGLLFLKKLDGARDKIVKLASRFVVDECSVLTHSRSRVVLQTLRSAREANRRFHVYVTRSAPDASGERMCADLRAAGVPCTLVLDSAVGCVMERVDFVMVGAEGVVESGGIVNKVGTYTIALCARETKKPLYVLTESFKFARLFPLGQRDLPDDFKYTAEARRGDLAREHPLVDYTPPGYLTLLFTDLGILTPSAVSDELIKLYL